MANGRPWFVRYANSLGGVAGLHAGEVGPFGVPFQPSNEAEELFLQADPLMYKEFPTQAAAAAWVASAAGQKDLGIGAGPGSAAKTALTSLNPLAGLFQANIWERVAMVGLGIILIAVGVAQLTHAVPIATKIATAVK